MPMCLCTHHRVLKEQVWFVQLVRFELYVELDEVTVWA